MELESLHERNVQNLNNTHDQMMSKKEQEHADAMDQMQRAHDAEIQRHEGIESELQREIDDLNQTIVDLNEDLERTKRKLSETEGMIQGMRD